MMETDVLVALASRTDRHHGEARRLLERLTAVKLSPYSLVELDLLIASQCLRVRLPDFYSALEGVLAYYGVEDLRPRPAHFEAAWGFRRRYGLTFFDSLHAAAAVKEGGVLVSYDEGYRAVEELEYRHPASTL